MERGQIEMLGQEVLTYESNIAYTLRFMIDTKVCLCLVWLMTDRRDELGRVAGWQV